MPGKAQAMPSVFLRAGGNQFPAARRIPSPPLSRGDSARIPRPARWRVATRVPGPAGRARGRRGVPGRTGPGSSPGDSDPARPGTLGARAGGPTVRSRLLPARAAGTSGRAVAAAGACASRVAAVRDRPVGRRRPRARTGEGRGRLVRLTDRSSTTPGRAAAGQPAGHFVAQIAKSTITAGNHDRESSTRFRFHSASDLRGFQGFPPFSERARKLVYTTCGVDQFSAVPPLHHPDRPMP